MTRVFNGDGKIDLAFANTTGNTLSVMLGNGDGTFAARKNSTTEGNPCNAIAADFNHDGKMDLAYTTQIDNQVHILPGNGDGTFGTQAVYATAKNPGYLTVGDFRGVGETDLAVTYRLGSETQYQCSILLNNGDGTFAPGIYTPLGGYAETTLAGDFNGDGKTDLVITEGAMTNVMLSDGDGTFTPLVKYNSRYGPYALVAADFNGDGKADLVEVNTGTNSVSWLRDSTSNDASINPLENIVSVSVADHLNSGAIVANLPGESSGAVSYALVSSAGSNDNALFCLNGFQLKTAVSFDYSYKNSYSIRLQVIATSRQVFENEFTVNIIEGKDAPVLDNSGDIYLRPINKELSANHNQGTLVKDIVGTHLTNTDANALEGIAITNTYDALGTWQFSLDGGTTWTDMGSVSATSSRLLAADDLTRIRLLPRSDAASQIVWAIYFRGWDQTVGVNGGTADTSTNGGSTAFSSNERYASIAVNSITVATYSDGNFRMDGCTDCKFDTSYYFGQAGDIAITGDWNGDGETEIGVFRNGTFILDTNDNGYVDSYDATVAFGTKGDKPVIGDWNGDGTSEVGVFRNGRL